MKVAIIGNHFVGKTTLFKILTNSASDEGILTLYDKRLEEIANIIKPKKITHAYIEICDNPKDLNLFDLLIIVVRGKKDLEDLKFKLILSDLKIVEKRIENLKKRGNNKELELFEKLKHYLEQEQFLCSIKLEQDEEFMLRGINFITRKPFIIVYNVFEGEEMEKLSESDYIISNLKLQEETKHLNFEEQLEFLKLYGFEPINEILINKIKEKLDIILFFTAGEKEVRSWILKNGKTIKEAAGKIHSDLEKGFVRAEVIHFEEFMKIKDLKSAKEKGLVRIEGKDYIVKDGDIVYIRASI
jgi:ribosome-binding ATPase YchF (GTP1/OBG family)